MCVNVPEWAPYVDEEDPQEQLTFGIYGFWVAISLKKWKTKHTHFEN